MKVTPLDIRRKEFKRSVRGYADEDVDLFLDEVADELERLYQENADLQERIRRLDEQLATHLQLRDALEKTLVTAQFQADETKANAGKEAESILRDAELKARGVVSDSYSEVQKVQQALVQLKHLEEDFRFKFQSLLEGHLKLLAEAPLDLPAGQPVVAEPAVPTPEPWVPTPEPWAPTAEPTVTTAEPAVTKAERAVTKAEPGAVETPFVVPVGLDDVPEYPSVAAPAPRPAPPVVPEPAVPEPADVAAISGLPEATDLPQVAAEEPVAASADGGEDITNPDAVTGSSTGMNDESVTLIREDDPLKGFFFTPQRDATDEGFFGADKGGKSKARDFEW